MSLVRLGDIPWNALQDTSEDRATLPPTSPSRSKAPARHKPDCDSLFTWLLWADAQWAAFLARGYYLMAMISPATASATAVDVLENQSSKIECIFRQIQRTMIERRVHPKTRRPRKKQRHVPAQNPFSREITQKVQVALQKSTPDPNPENQFYPIQNHYCRCQIEVRASNNLNRCETGPSQYKPLAWD
ncbi:similar to An08g06260 [Aspergillus luchuensis]|uniref:Similar to An08g06260 n=1 Tax=Aspergillus kawachii TaxID=1069201 RepID=A0A146FC15_ASPKA|nr:similar to An08g06260 [Aspergillus luchuensis]